MFRSAACDEIVDSQDPVYSEMRTCSNPVLFATVPEWDLTFVACNASIMTIASNFRDSKSRVLDLRAVRKGFPSFSSKWVYWKTGININTIEKENEETDEETYLRHWFTGLQVHGRENAYDVTIFATTAGCSLGVFRFEHWRKQRIRRKRTGSIPSLIDMMKMGHTTYSNDSSTRKKKNDVEEEMDPTRFAMIRMQIEMSDRIRDVCLHTKRKTRECLKVHTESLLRRARVLVSNVDRIEKHQSDLSGEIERVMKISDMSLEMVTRLSASSDVCTVRLNSSV